MNGPEAPTLQAARCLLWQAGKAVAEEALAAAWSDLRQRNTDPSVLELLADLRARGLLTGSLLACEEAPALLASTRAAGPPPQGGGPDAAQEPTAPPLEGAAGGWGYELVELLGEGGMGAVYLAWDRRLLRQSAVKRLKAAGAGAAAVARFVHEAQVLSQLDHPNVLPVYALDVGPDGEAACALKLVRGRTLEALVADHRARGPTFANAALADRLELFLKVCEGVHYAHSRGVLHRDLKPANVMTGEHGEVYVLDWGLCKLVRRAGEPADDGAVAPAGDAPKVGVELERTRVGAVLGTPLYFSPEQAEGDPAKVGLASDQYALGLLLHELVALQTAYEPSGLKAVLRQASEARRRPWPAWAAVDPDLAAIVAKATALRPEDRYASVRALADDVRRLLRREETLARPDTPPRALRRWIGRRAGAVVAALAAALVLVLAGTAWSWTRRQLDLARARAEAEARTREEQAARLVLDRRAARVVRHFLWYAAELEGFASAAEQALLAGAPSTEPAYDRARFEAQGGGPPDLAPSPRYQSPVSPTWPLCEAPAGADPAAVARERARLLAVRPRLVDLFRAAPGDGASEAVASRRSPPRPGEAAQWAYVILETTGLTVLLPGTAGPGWAPGYDLRQVPTYREARADALAGRTRSWSAAYDDLLGQGRLVTRNRALLDPEGALLGVASIDLSLDDVARRDLAPGEGVRRAALLDDRGGVLVATEGGGARSAGGERLALAPYGRPEVVARLAGGETRGLLRPTGEAGPLVAWQRLEPLPWTLLVEVGGPEPAR